MKNILITGGQGFLGYNLYKKLKSEYKIVLVDNLRTSKFKESKLFNNIDLRYYSETLENLIRESDIIIHLASSVGVKDIDSGLDSHYNSYLIDFNVLGLCKKYNKFTIYTSTSEVYGSGDFLSENSSFNLRPLNRSSYAANKLNSEFIVKSLSRYLILRPFNITGSGQLPNYGMVLPRFIEQAKSGKPLTIYGSGEQIRSFCDVRDFCNSVKILIETPESHNNTYNIGSYNKISIKDLAERVLKKIPGSTTYIDFKDVYSEQSFDIERRTPDLTKLQKFYKVKYSIDDIIESMIKEFKSYDK